MELEGFSWLPYPCIQLRRFTPMDLRYLTLRTTNSCGETGNGSCGLLSSSTIIITLIYRLLMMLRMAGTMTTLDHGRK